MNKKILICILLLVFLIFSILFYEYFDNKLKIDNSLFSLKEDLSIGVYEDIRASYFIKDIKGKIIEDKKVNTKQIGNKKVSFIYRNKKNKKRKGTFYIKVVDLEKPLVWISNKYNIKVGSKDNLLDNIMCADNYDTSPSCEIIGEYNLNEKGAYPLTYVAKDSSNNINSIDFTLNVYEPVKSNSYKEKYTNFNDVVKEYKTSNTEIGIDVSKWQKDIDFKKVKTSGASFVMIRLGYQDGIKGNYVLDSYFEKNIENAIKNGIKVGVYFYSYADSKKEAKKQAKWVINKVKRYKISLPIAFDWECYTSFNRMDLSLFGLGEVADSFLNEVKNSGYKVMLYGSKNYLNGVWKYNDYDVWLAHYTKKTDYKGKYIMWQMCENGIIDGIEEKVDINILYF